MGRRFCRIKDNSMRVKVIVTYLGNHIEGKFRLGSGWVMQRTNKNTIPVNVDSGSMRLDLFGMCSKVDGKRGLRH